MKHQDTISLSGLLHCLLHGHERIADEAIPSDPDAFAGASEILPSIITAAQRDSIQFFGVPTQTRFQFDKNGLDDNAERAIRKAVRYLQRSFELPSDDDLHFETHLEERYLPSDAEAIPTEVWRTNALVWQIDQLLVWNSYDLD